MRDAITGCIELAHPQDHVKKGICFSTGQHGLTYAVNLKSITEGKMIYRNVQKNPLWWKKSGCRTNTSVGHAENRGPLSSIKTKLQGRRG